MRVHALLAPPLLTRCVRHVPPVMVEISDSPDFLHNPINFISQHPELFSEDLQEMAAYQLTIQSDQFSLFGSLPEALDECAGRASVLRQKSMRAHELSQIILDADQQTMHTLAADATFEEKRALFQALAALPEDNRGMRAIDDVVSRNIDWSPQGPQAKFGQDLDRVIAIVAEANDALQKLDEEYSTLFLSVRRVARMARAAVETKQI